MYRWTDPVMGPRKMPDLKTPLAGLSEVTSDLKFSINTEKGSVMIGDTNLEAGLVFTVSQD